MLKPIADNYRQSGSGAVLFGIVHPKMIALRVRI